MTGEKIGIWLIGAWGGVATTAAVGLAALKKQLIDETALVSALPRFARLELTPWSEFVVGGHEIRETDYATEARALHRQSGVIDENVLQAVLPQLQEFDSRIRPGTVHHVGPTIGRLAEGKVLSFQDEPPRKTIERLQADIEAFRSSNGLRHVVVVNVASTEPAGPVAVEADDWPSLWRLLETGDDLPLPASTLYAVAAMRSGCSYINFTPSVGSHLKPLEDLAIREGVVHMGRDGKTGETLLKSVLAPMFAARHLKVLSWVGHNIFGNLDARILDDPVNKASKVHSKDHLLGEILGYHPQTLVSIEYIESMADWKTAWDHIHFRGFLGTKMALQFIWQGCDSLLAAPLVLDLVRFAEREARRGKSGLMPHLSSFFKSPMGTDVAAFDRQYLLLEQWADEVAAESSSN